MAVQTWEQWAQQNGVDPSGPPPKAGEGENQARHHWFDVHNQWTDYISQSGVNPEQMGIFNKHEQGQSIYAGWNQTWQQRLQSGDPKAQQFMASPQYKQYLQTYGNPEVAFQNWSYLQSVTNNPKAGGNLTPIGNGLLYSGGANGQFYNDLNQAVTQKQAIGTKVGNLTYTGAGWVGPDGQPVAHPLAYSMQAGAIPTAKGANPNQYGPLGAPSGWQTGSGFSGAGYAPFGGSINTAGAGPVSFSSTGYNPYGFTTSTTPQGAGSSDSLGKAGTGSVPAGTNYQPGSVGAAVQSKTSSNTTPDPGTFSYNAPPYTGPDRPQFNFPGVPQFKAPVFTPPNAQTMTADPSYQFRLDQGLKALQASAAARGVLNSGGTLKGIEDYGQNAASQEYGNIFNRALQTYGTQYQGAKDMFAPLFANYQNLFGAEQNAGLAAYNQAWQRYQFGLDDEFRREQMMANMQAPA